MKQKLFILGLFASVYGFSQQAVVPGGGDAVGSNGTASYSIGQVTYETNSSASGTVTQGVQQPFEIFINSGLAIKGVDLSFSAFPNPTFDELYLKITDRSLQNLSYTIIDKSGRLIANDDVNQNMSTIDMKAYAQGVYTINILENKSVIKSFKIFKN